MSAFFIAINRNQAEFQHSTAELMMAQLDRFGTDGSELLVKDNFAIGYQRLWTVPEEQGERQPLYDKDHDLWLVFYGRIDNREALYGLLQTYDSASLSDARLLLALYKAHGDAIFKKIIGPFVFVFYSAQEQSIIAARDAMGGRYLVYRISDQHVLIATYEMAIVGHPSVAYQFNDQKMVRMLANLIDDVPTSLINGIEPLHPGQKLELTPSTYKLTSFYLPDPKKRIRLDSNRAYAVEFRRLLTQAVNRRLRSITPIGTMLSGGMDSVPISIVAALLLKRKGQTLNSFSWVFDEHPKVDERQYSSDICEKFAIRPSWINCDSVWPRFDQDTHQNPIMPFSSPYAEFNQTLFRQASASGVGVILSGIGGDMLYCATDAILYELLSAGRFGDLVDEFKSLYVNTPSKRRFIKKYLLAPVLRSWLERRRLRQPIKTDYLTPEAQRSLKNQPSYLDSIQRQSLRPQQYFNVVSAFEGEDAGYGKFMEAKYAIERRYPFRDRELAEFMLAIPSDQLFYAMTARPIVKRAFATEFTQALLNRNSKTDFTPVINYGIQSDQRVQKWFNQENADWQRFVNAHYLATAPGQDPGSNMLKWRCGYYEFWKTVCYTAVATKLGLFNEKHEA